MHELRSWRLAHGLSLRQAAQLFGVYDGKVVHRWETGEYIPSRGHMTRIYVATRGDVRPDHFYELPQLQAA